MRELYPIGNFPVKQIVPVREDFSIGNIAEPQTFANTALVAHNAGRMADKLAELRDSIRLVVKGPRGHGRQHALAKRSGFRSGTISKFVRHGTGLSAPNVEHLRQSFEQFVLEDLPPEDRDALQRTLSTGHYQFEGMPSPDTASHGKTAAASRKAGASHAEATDREKKLRTDLRVAHLVLGTLRELATKVARAIDLAVGGDDVAALAEIEPLRRVIGGATAQKSVRRRKRKR